ncbi:MAG: PilZ domain-containing protein [Phycisphaerae bacterium]
MEQIVPSQKIETAAESPAFPGERREHKRLEMHLPVEVVHVGASPAVPILSTTHNVSAGGIYFEAPAGLLDVGNEVHFSLSVPPGPGYFPYAGRGKGVADIVRIDALPSAGHETPRVGVAARFSQPLKLVF